jgi:hypothetical protein
LAVFRAIGCLCDDATAKENPENPADPRDNLSASEGMAEAHVQQPVGYRCSEGFAYSDFEQSTATKRTKTERFVDQIEAVHGKALIELIEPH